MTSLTPVILLFSTVLAVAMATTRWPKVRASLLVGLFALSWLGFWAGRYLATRTLSVAADAAKPADVDSYLAGGYAMAGIMSGVTYPSLFLASLLIAFILIEDWLRVRRLARLKPAAASATSDRDAE